MMEDEMTDIKDNEVFQAFKRRTLERVRKAHGHWEDADDVDLLCLSISNLSHMNTERIEVMRLNAGQAQIIARLEREKANLLKRVEGDGFDLDYLHGDDEDKVK
jgi:hypothetical protein